VNKSYKELSAKAALLQIEYLGGKEAMTVRIEPCGYIQLDFSWRLTVGSCWAIRWINIIDIIRWMNDF
jgi:hypothetical protein